MSVEWSPTPRDEAAPEAGGGWGSAIDVAVGLLGEGIDALDGRGVASRLAEVERAIRRFEGLAVELVASADRRELFRDDGHVSVRGWVKASVRLSDVEVTQRVRCARLVNRKAGWGEAMASGRLGVAQFRELARVGANRRCGAQLDDVAEAMVTVATTVSFEDFWRVIREWEHLADGDGAHRDGDHAHDTVSRRGAGSVTSGISMAVSPPPKAPRSPKCWTISWRPSWPPNGTRREHTR